MAEVPLRSEPPDRAVNLDQAERHVAAVLTVCGSWTASVGRPLSTAACIACHAFWRMPFATALPRGLHAARSWQTSTATRSFPTVMTWLPTSGSRMSPSCCCVFG